MGMWVNLADLANKSTEQQVKLEFQVNNEYFFWGTSMSHAIL